MLKTCMIVLCLVVLAGCATKRTEEEIEWRRGVDQENLISCLNAYKQARQPWVSLHRHDKNTKHRPADVKQDLVVNVCKQVLGDAYIRY